MALLGPLSASALTVDQVFQEARKNNEDLAAQGQNVIQSEERYKQTRGAVLPNVSGSLSYLWQDRGAQPGTTGSSTSTYQPVTKLTAAQPLFRGFREYKSLSLAKEEIRAEKELRRHAEYELFKAITSSFYTVISLEKDLTFVNEQIKLYDDRIKELNRYIKLGRTRSSEVLTARTNRSLLAAQVETIGSQVRAARENLTAISGLPPEVELTDEGDPQLSQVQPMDFYLSRRDQRPDVRANQERMGASQKSVDIAKGSHLPSVDFNYNHYLERTGNAREVDWDAQILVTVPLFEGGATQARVRESASVNEQARLELNQSQRVADTEIRTTYASVMAGFRQLGHLSDSVQTARQAFDRESRDYRNGLVTNFEVLTTLTTVTEAQRTLNRIRYNLKADMARLRAAAALELNVN